LPGALMRNAGLKFICKAVTLDVATTSSDFTGGYTVDAQIDLPVAHHDGNYVVTDETLAELKGEDRVAFRYASDLNGSTDRIAGVLSENRRVLGLMPHPERASDEMLGNVDGKRILETLISA